MSLKLKRESVWLDFLLLSDDTNEAHAIIIGDDGCQVPVPAVILLAASPLVRSLSAPSCCPVAISVPTVSEDVLRAVVEIMKVGQVEMNYELIDDVADVLKLLEVGAELISEKVGRVPRDQRSPPRILPPRPKHLRSPANLSQPLSPTLRERVLSRSPEKRRTSPRIERPGRLSKKELLIHKEDASGGENDAEEEEVIFTEIEEPENSIKSGDLEADLQIELAINGLDSEKTSEVNQIDVNNCVGPADSKTKNTCHKPSDTVDRESVHRTHHSSKSAQKAAAPPPPSISRNRSSSPEASKYSSITVAVSGKGGSRKRVVLNKEMGDKDMGVSNTEKGGSKKRAVLNKETGYKDMAFSNTSTGMSEDMDEYVIDKILTESSEVNTKVKKECLTEMGIVIENKSDETRKLETKQVGNLGNRKKLKSRGKLDLQPDLCERPFECDVCEYKAKTRRHLIQHKKMHSKEKPFECVQCDYKAKHRTHLKTHAKIHTGDSRPFHCDQCEYKARERGNMKIHMKSHTGEGPFECDMCQFKAKEWGSIIRHKRTHDEKPYGCDLCKYKGNTSSALSRHKTIYHV